MSGKKEFKKGDVVKLKTGSPRMTVARYDSDSDIICQWFTGNDEDGWAGPFREDFAKEALVLAEEKKEEKSGF